MVDTPNKRAHLPCCDREAQQGEYLLANEAGACCVGCWLSSDLAEQGGAPAIVEALKGEPFILSPEKIAALKRADQDQPLAHTKPHPDADCRGCNTPLIRDSKLVAHANQCPDCGEFLCMPCFEGGKVKCRVGKNCRN